MNLTITSLGEFERYEPDERPEGLPEEVSFTRRLSDGADWYGLIHGAEPVIAPEAGVLYAMGVPLLDGTFEVQPVVSHPDRLFPQAGAVVLRIEGYTGTNAQDELGRGKTRWTPDTHTLT